MSLCRSSPLMATNVLTRPAAEYGASPLARFLRHELGEHVGHGLRGLRPREVEALSLVAAELRRVPALRFRLDALRGHAQAEAMGKPDDAADDRGVTPSVGVEAGNEGAVDLHRVDGETLEDGERRVADTEVVERQVGPDSADGLHGGHHR